MIAGPCALVGEACAGTRQAKDGDGRRGDCVLENSREELQRSSTAVF